MCSWGVGAKFTVCISHLKIRFFSPKIVSVDIIHTFLPLLGDSTEDNQGKVLLHNEHSILSILQDNPGVIRHHGLFKESHRIILVLSCVYKHDYDHDKKYQVCCLMLMLGEAHRINKLFVWYKVVQVKNIVCGHAILLFNDVNLELLC